MDSEQYGVHRVVGEDGTLPQRAQRLDPSLPIRDSELLVAVAHLNIDAASFRQMKNEAAGDVQRIAAAIQHTVLTRGKMHNPVTGSGGMLVGRVQAIGRRHPDYGKLKVGDPIASLVSLTLTPLAIEEIVAIHLDSDRIDIRGHAILFATGLYARLPEDLPWTVSLAALDVCGAPALVARHVRPGMKVLVIGAGKSGALCLAQARRSLAGEGQLIGLDISAEALSVLKKIGICDLVVELDAARPMEMLRRVSDLTGGTLCDLAINCASVPNTETGTLLSLREGGTAIFFSMATSFTAAALGAEGLGKDVTLLIGNGYVKGHAEHTLELLRSEPGLRALFEQRYR